MNEKYQDNTPVDTDVPCEYTDMIADDLDRFALGECLAATQSLVDSLGYTGDDLLALQKDARPTRTVERPFPDGRSMEYAFMVDYGSRADAGGDPIVECRFVLTERSDIMILSEMSYSYRRAILETIARKDEEDEFDEGLLEALASETIPDDFADVECRGYFTYDYTCDLASGVFEKSAYGAFSVGNKEVTFLHAAEPLGDVEDQLSAYEYYTDMMESEEQAAHLVDWLSDINDITEEDLSRMKEVLYWLELPGGILVEDVTDDYVN